MLIKFEDDKTKKIRILLNEILPNFNETDRINIILNDAENQISKFH